MIKKEEKEIKEHESATEIDSIIKFLKNPKNIDFFFYSEFSTSEDNHISSNYIYLEYFFYIFINSSLNY